VDGGARHNQQECEWMNGCSNPRNSQARINDGSGGGDHKDDDDERTHPQTLELKANSTQLNSTQLTDTGDIIVIIMTADMRDDSSSRRVIVSSCVLFMFPRE
jgi:hypothetical protein